MGKSEGESKSTNEAHAQRVVDFVRYIYIYKSWRVSLYHQFNIMTRGKLLVLDLFSVFLLFLLSSQGIQGKLHFHQERGLRI